MIRLIAVAFALALASSAQAMPHSPLQQTDGVIIQVRQGCGLGRQPLMESANAIALSVRWFASVVRIKCAT
jgi:hypothetical protein